MALIVIDPGLSTTVQDEGRPGYREWGVPVGGAFDRSSAGLSNALLGNSRGCAVVELTLVGGTFQADCAMAMALAGAPMEAKITGPNSGEHLIQLPASFSLGAGDRLILGRTVDGARTYLSVKGGWQTAPRLGSRSTEKRLERGDILPGEIGTIPNRRFVRLPWRSASDEPIRIVPGPDAPPDGALDELLGCGRRFHVDSRSNRVGLRLKGEPLPVSSPPGRLSTPVAPGAIQVAGGQLIVLGVDCGTMGGYPHVAHVVSVDIDRIGQLKPGDTITFRGISLDDARALDDAARQVRGALLRRIATLLEDEGGSAR